MSLATIRTGAQTRLETISGLKVYDRPPDSINDYPCAFIVPRVGDYDTEFTDGVHWMLEITMLFRAGADIARAQSSLDPYIDRSGASSVYAAIDGDDTLGGAADTSRIIGFRDYGVLEYNGQPYVGVKFDLEVWS